MRNLFRAMRGFAACLLLLAIAPAQAQVSQTHAWQAVVTAQIEAFRHGDAPVALSYAGAAFQENFPDATVFYRTILTSGYAPIALSVSHSFGLFEQTGPHEVAQVVRFVGPRQELYQALYQLSEEPAGWRVQGVVLGRAQGVGI